jgi:putative lipoprotein (rSAM/lipoprotein system)
MSKIFGRFLLMILGALGLTGCDSISGPNPTPEYGCPYADYTLSGTVVDADSSKAIEGIKIQFGADSDTLTALSDAEGKWHIAGRLWCVFRYNLCVADVDGDANRGAFMPDTLQLNPTLVPPSPKPFYVIHDKWYSGTCEQHDIVVTLEKTP